MEVKYYVEYNTKEGLGWFPYPDWDSAFEHYMLTKSLKIKGLVLYIKDVETGELHQP